MKKKYTLEFKQQAVELAESLKNTSEASKQLGVSDGCIYAWKKLFQKKENSKISSTASESEEIRRLRKENSDLKKINHVLKAAAAFFSQDHLK